MSVKKYFGLTAAGIASLVASSAMAGGPDVMAAPTPDYSGFYIDANVGYARSNWTDFLGGIFFPTGQAAGPGTVTSNGTGFAWGGDFGYQFNQYFGFEFGGYDLPSASGQVGTGFFGAPLGAGIPSPGPAKVESWLLYAAGKLTIPLFENFDIFGKAGIAWRFLDYTGSGITSVNSVLFGTRQTFNDQHYATWVAGAGLQYWFTPEWSINAQYLHFPGRNKFQEPGQQSPNVDLFVAGVGYKFNV